MTRPTLRLAGALIALGALASPALAHHPLGGDTPATLMQGFLSGVGHPMLGVDHFAFIVAMGLMAAMLGRAFLAPLAFLGAAGLGVMLTVAGLGLPMVEPMVAGTATLAGALVLRGKPVGAGAAMALFAVAGLFHGAAFGAAVVGAEATPVAAYLAGLALTQYAIAVGAGLVAMRLWRETGQGAMGTRLTGAVMAGVGAAFLFEVVEGMVFGPIA